MSGWPTDPAELARKNAAHLALPNANSHYVDSRENVYADVYWDTDTHVSGESTFCQLHNLIQIVNEKNVKHLLQCASTGVWQRSFADDVFLAIALHKSDAELALLIGLSLDVIKQWSEQACQVFFDNHIKITTGPNDRERMSVAVQLAAWKDLVNDFRAQHEKPDSDAFRRLSCCESGVIDRMFCGVSGRSVVEDFGDRE